MMVANAGTGQWATVMSFFDLERFFRDIDVIVDSARGKTLTVTQLGLSFLRNFDEKKAPGGLTPLKMLELFDGKMGGGVAGRKEQKKSDWRITSILSMWFQDLWNYDFRRTEMCVIPYGTQEGEISFCAYNTGVGWRNIIEEMRQVASTKDWYGEGSTPDLRRGPPGPAAQGPQAPAAGRGRGGRERERQWHTATPTATPRTPRRVRVAAAAAAAPTDRTRQSTAQNGSFTRRAPLPA